MLNKIKTLRLLLLIFKIKSIYNMIKKMFEQV